jgi:hypothetical protein
MRPLGPGGATSIGLVRPTPPAGMQSIDLQRPAAPQVRRQRLYVGSFNSCMSSLT